MKQRRFIVSALSGGSGKTLCSLGLSTAFKSKGHAVLPFKKGPDYIDTAWLSLATERAAYNLDPFFSTKEELQAHFYTICSKHTNEEEKSIALIEGNRGLYDGKDIYGSTSTAELSVILNTPVILTVNAQKTTRTLAALINGIVAFDSRVHILGIIFNNIASSRHEKIIYDTVSHYCTPKVFGFIPRFEKNPMKERHLGLKFELNSQENKQFLNSLSQTILSSVNTDFLLSHIEELEPLQKPRNLEISQVKQEEKEVIEIKKEEKTRIGYIKDNAIWFYYTENLEALKSLNIELVELSLFDTQNWDTIHALYIGGGYPELYAEKISKSETLHYIKNFAQKNMPIFAECGGFMLLTRTITADKKKYKMAHLFDVDLDFHNKPRGLGYIEAKIVKENPFFKLHSTVKGHEFHYSLAYIPPKENIFQLNMGTGMGEQKDALQYNNVFACYTHIYAPCNKQWAINFVALAHNYKTSLL